MSDHGDIQLINAGKVDSRLESKRVTHPTLPLERTFCVFCGKPKGWVSHDSADYIDAQNIVVVCDSCNSKFDEKLGKLPGPEVRIPEIQLRDAEIGIDQSFLDGLSTNTMEWIENCIDCRIPMVKLQPMPPNKCLPMMETLRTGDTVMDQRRTAAVDRAKPQATPQWFCRKCRTLWGAIDMFWCKFRRV